MIVETFPVGPLACNCTILADEESRRALVVDPGDDAGEILRRLGDRGLALGAMVSTHAHIDHVSAIAELQDASGAPASIHENDLFLYENLEAQAVWLGVRPPRKGRLDRFLEHGDVVSEGSIRLDVLHTPGHTPGSLSFHFENGRNVMFTGDTLFLHSVGRTDLWGGSMPDLLESIRKRLLCFDDETLVIPGHGPSTTIGRERRENPFLR
jgi:glyoxylase-like metal-dependent hydrolase (beta-lactamase superfamily II)